MTTTKSAPLRRAQKIFKANDDFYRGTPMGEVRTEPANYLLFQSGISQARSLLKSTLAQLAIA